MTDITTHRLVGIFLDVFSVTTAVKRKSSEELHEFSSLKGRVVIREIPSLCNITINEEAQSMDKRMED
jgi:hypothetical protein